MFRPTRTQLNLEALKHNVKSIKEWNGADFFCPMVKSNAYGHGALAVARVVEEIGASALGVALVEEGLQLRSGGITMPILVFAPFDHAAVSAMLTHQLTPVVTRMADLDAIASLKSKGSFAVHIKFNTGMSRLGFDQEDLPTVRKWLAAHPEVKVEGVCTHLSFGEEILVPGSVSQLQLKRLMEMKVGFTGVVHGHKSATISAHALQNIKKPPGVGTRPGISMYGLAHDINLIGPGLQPVLSWKTQLAHVHRLRVGDAVSYGARWTAKRDSIIGMLPVGYADGYRRGFSNKTEVLFRGQRVPCAGTVCMDYTMVDLTDAVSEGAAKIGEEVVLLGRQGEVEITASELAERAGTISYEIVTAISDRVLREVQ